MERPAALFRAVQSGLVRGALALAAVIVFFLQMPETA
jgi:hypothetical protein